MKPDKAGKIDVPKIPPALTGCAGEHFVAYRLSAMGYVVALTRAGAPSINMMVGTADGRNALTIQVKTKRNAYCPAKRTKKKQEPACWEWQLNKKDEEPCGKSAFYVFVDLKWPKDSLSALSQIPDPFIVPADLVAQKIREALGGCKRDDGTGCSVGVWGQATNKLSLFFWIAEAEAKQWHEAWHFIKHALDDRE